MSECGRPEDVRRGTVRRELRREFLAAASLHTAAGRRIRDGRPRASTTIRGRIVRFQLANTPGKEHTARQTLRPLFWGLFEEHAYGRLVCVPWKRSLHLVLLVWNPWNTDMRSSRSILFLGMIAS